MCMNLHMVVVVVVALTITKVVLFMQFPTLALVSSHRGLVFAFRLVPQSEM